MKVKYLPFYVVVVLLLVTGCNDKTKSDKKKTEEVEKDTVPEVSYDVSKDSISFEGTYFGVLPCGSCPGINTLITFYKGGTYEKTQEYLESDDVAETTKGDYTWDKSRQMITIKENAYLIEDDQLRVLDKNHKKIEGELSENYILTKTELEPPLDSNEGYTLQIFTDSDKNNYNIIFNTNPKIPTAFVQTKEFNKMLSQTQSWAKGAEYSSGSTTLIVKGDNAVLTIKSRKIELKEKE